MFPLGVLKKEQVGSTPPLLVLSCPFATNIIDITSRHTLTVISGTPTFSDGSMLIDSTDKIRTGTADGQENADFDFTANLFEINCDVKMVDSAESSIWIHSAYNADTYPALRINGSTNVVRVMTYTGTYYLTYTCPFDVKADFFNVKLRKKAGNNHDLLINDVVVSTISTIANVLENPAVPNPYRGFMVGQANNNVAFRIKNFTVKKYV